MIPGNNSILNKATEAKKLTDESQIREQINLAYHSALIEGKGKVNESLLVVELEKEFGERNTGYTLTDSEDDKYWVVTRNNVIENIPKSNNSETNDVEENIEGLTGVDFGEKTKDTIAIGEDLTIGDENFRVLSKTSSKIVAVPFYNITLDVDNPVQSDSLYYIPFSSSGYWGTDHTIDMSGPNNVQQYITAYSNKLKSITNNKVTARIARVDDFVAPGENTSNQNPSRIGGYWTGHSASSGYVMYIYTNGVGYPGLCSPEPGMGIRPFIEIDIS